MNTYGVTLLSSMFLVLAACSDTDEPFAPAGQVLATESVAAAGHQATGSGHVEGAAGLREFTFHALEESDVGAKGSFKVVLANGAFFEADATCLAVDGDTAWVGGVIRDSSIGAIIGTTSMFWVRDGGEGAGAEDIVSTAAFLGGEGDDLAFCENRPLELPPMIVTQGNVDVR